MSTDFFAAIKAGNADEVQRLLSRDPGLIHAREKGLSPVLVAAYHHQQGIASYVADKTVKLTIFEASAIGRTTQVMMLLAHNPLLVNAVAEDGFHPLGLACFFGHKDTVEYLLKAGAQVNVFSQNPLHAAPIQSAAAAGQLEIVTMLVQFGAEVNVREQGGYTPLHAAAQNGDLDMLRFLVLNGADQEATSNDGKIPLDLALEAEKPAAVKFLKEGITRRFKGRRSPAASK